MVVVVAVVVVEVVVAVVVAVAVTVVVAKQEVRKAGPWCAMPFSWSGEHFGLPMVPPRAEMTVEVTCFDCSALCHLYA